MTRAWSIVMIVPMEHCDEKAGNTVMTEFMEHCHERGHGALR